jgi:hypothetical protein
MELRAFQLLLIMWSISERLLGEGSACKDAFVVVFKH